uniref:BSD domain-containing protein n=1 Tax=Daucus carota subsp. sativus TaxID=79200 RepID=A0A161WYU8_DAUCS
MKITALLVVKCHPAGADPVILANATDVSHFGYFQRPSVREFIVFVGRTVASRTPPSQRQSVQHEDEEGGANCGDDATSKSSGIRNDLSEWQQQHAILVLSKSKELSQLRFKLCPRYLKERDFWRIYFTLAKNILAEYELRAVRLHKLNQMKLETQNGSDTSAYEVEMSETKLGTT